MRDTPFALVCCCDIGEWCLSCVYWERPPAAAAGPGRCVMHSPAETRDERAAQRAGTAVMT